MERLAEAVGERTRRRILLAFYDEPAPRTVDEVASGAGVHRTVAFNHLERLVALGYLVSDLRRGLPGKPAKLYRAEGRLEITHPQRRFAELAPLLAGALEELGAAGPAAAREAGRRFGGGLESIDELGADYVVEGDMITANNCVFREACDRAREVVCSLHAGLLEVALQHPHVEPAGPLGTSGCRFLIKENDR